MAVTLKQVAFAPPNASAPVNNSDFTTQLSGAACNFVPNFRPGGVRTKYLDLRECWIGPSYFEYLWDQLNAVDAQAMLTFFSSYKGQRVWFMMFNVEAASWVVNEGLLEPPGVVHPDAGGDVERGFTFGFSRLKYS